MIRPAGTGDLVAINDIYNHWVLHSTATYQTEPATLPERRRWFAAHGDRYPVLVIEAEGRIVGWGSLSPYHARSAYADTVENSVYRDSGRLGRGLGSLMLAALLERGVALGHHTVLARISADQESSIALHRKFGFREVARLHEVGFKFGRRLDLVYYQKMLEPA